MNRRKLYKALRAIPDYIDHDEQKKVMSDMRTRLYGEDTVTTPPH